MVSFCLVNCCFANLDRDIVISLKQEIFALATTRTAKLDKPEREE